MKDIEKLLIWFIPLFILEYFLQTGFSWAYSETINISSGKASELSNFYSSLGISTGVATLYLTYTASLLNFAVKAPVAIWLYFAAKKANGKPILWLFFGAFAGVISIAIFYLVKINEAHLQNAKT